LKQATKAALIPSSFFDAFESFFLLSSFPHAAINNVDANNRCGNDDSKKNDSKASKKDDGIKAELKQATKAYDKYTDEQLN
jgi:iron uptake system EfeUOB component EfeO/EfeM